MNRSTLDKALTAAGWALTGAMLAELIRQVRR